MTDEQMPTTEEEAHEEYIDIPAELLKVHAFHRNPSGPDVVSERMNLLGVRVL